MNEINDGLIVRQERRRNAPSEIIDVDSPMFCNSLV